MPKEVENTLRIDKWLWAVRLFKTRSQATQECKSGKVKIDGEPVKPSRDVKEGMLITIQTGAIQKTVKVIALLDKRVGAKLVNEYMEDITPDEEYQKLEVVKSRQILNRKKGLGRPTKKERRNIDDWIGWAKH